MRHQELSLQWDGRSDPAGLLEREWLVTNGLGGYASGSLAGAVTRQYHGLFVPNLSSPKGRHVLISRCDETVIVGEHSYHISNAELADGTLIGEAHRWLRSFRLRYGIPRWIFELDDTVVERSIVMPHMRNTVCARYRVLSGAPIGLRIRPFVSFRRHDQAPTTQCAGPFALSVERGRHEIRLAGSPLTLRVALQPGPTVFTTDEHEYLEHGHRIDRNRGDEFLETVFSPGWLRARASLDQPACFVASTHAWEHLEFDASSVFDAEEHRLQKLIAGSHVGNDAVAARFVVAADQFVVLPGSRLEENVVTQAQGEELRTVYAGYHWFGDWGRDTMISLEGLTLCTGRYHEAGAILRTFSHYVKDGLLPNLFPEGERQALYHTVDATLWYFHAIARYVEITGDRELVEQLFPVLQSIVHQHVQGTRFGIHVDARDGLVTAAADGYQLTWMDAKVDDWVVTPRRGKPVEIQALWYNALQLMRAWAQQLGQACAAYEELGEQVHHTFNERFWNNGFLFDVVDGPEGDDASVRPNQIFAVSLPHPVLKQPYWRPVIDGVGERLLTPFGLRTLDPGHPSYQRHYRGDLRARDAAYHQGTVWPWLIGPFVDAWLKVHPNNAPARELLSAFEMHLGDAGVGSISEIFDAEAPHLPGGCIAQAWSVAEVLRAWLATRDADDTSQLSSVYERDDGR